MTNLKTRRLKETNGICYLNNPKSEEFLHKEIPPFTQNLAQATTEMESLTQNRISAKLIGIQNASKTLSCASCKKKVSVKSNGNIATCPSCKMMMKTSSCKSQWFLKCFSRTLRTEMTSLHLSSFILRCINWLQLYPALTST